MPPKHVKQTNTKDVAGAFSVDTPKEALILFFPRGSRWRGSACSLPPNGRLPERMPPPWPPTTSRQRWRGSPNTSLVPLPRPTAAITEACEACEASQACEACEVCGASVSHDKGPACNLRCVSSFVAGEVEMRWIDAYFPFTDPSYELEIFFQVRTRCGGGSDVLACLQAYTHTRIHAYMHTCGYQFQILCQY